MLQYFQRGTLNSVLIFAEIILTFMSFVCCVIRYFLDRANFVITVTLPV